MSCFYIIIAIFTLTSCKADQTIDLRDYLLPEANLDTVIYSYNLFHSADSIGSPAYEYFLDHHLRNPNISVIESPKGDSLIHVTTERLIIRKATDNFYEFFNANSHNSHNKTYFSFSKNFLNVFRFAKAGRISDSLHKQYSLPLFVTIGQKLNGGQFTIQKFETLSFGGKQFKECLKIECISDDFTDTSISFWINKDVGVIQYLVQSPENTALAFLRPEHLDRHFNDNFFWQQESFNAFSKPLQKAILGFIHYQETLNETKRHPFPKVIVVTFENSKVGCIINISNSPYYSRPLLKAFAYYKDYMIAYYDGVKNCNQHTINVDRLRHNEVQLFPNESSNEKLIPYQSIIQKYHIHDADSLELIFTDME